jgi:DNA-binding transcriptional MerR regulator
MSPVMKRRDVPEAGVDQRFTSSEVVAVTGITPRQLQWWDERGIVRPAREGRVRVYSAGDLAEVAVICELRSRGFSLQRVRKVMRFLQREFGKRLLETVTSGSDYHLLTDGQRIFLETDTRQIIDILKNARQPMLTVCLTDTMRRLGGNLPHPTTVEVRQPAARSKVRTGVPKAKSHPKVLPFAGKSERGEPVTRVQRTRTVGRR